MQSVEDLEIKTIALREHPTDFSLQKYIYNNQLAAKMHMTKVDNSRTNSKTTDEYDKSKNIKAVNDKAKHEHDTVKTVKDNTKTTAGPSKTTANSTRIDNLYVESNWQASKGLNCKQGDNIVLCNRSDSVFAIYKNYKLDNITNLFTNGIKATIKDYKIFSDKPTVYKVQFALKDGSVYGGWVCENAISN
jgi:hypothetical protein